MAALYGNSQVVEGLLRGMWDENGTATVNAQPNPKDNFGATPLFYCEERRMPPNGKWEYKETEKMLCDAGGIKEGTSKAACVTM